MSSSHPYPPCDHEAWCLEHPEKMVPPEVRRTVVEQIVVLLRQWSCEYEAQASNGLLLSARMLEDHFKVKWSGG